MIPAMIDLPISGEDDTVDLHPKILLYNNLLGIISSLILIISGFFAVRLLIGDLEIGALTRLVGFLLFLVSILQVLDIYFWYLIRQQTENSIRSASSLYLIPVFVDLLLVFAIGFGLLPLFFRIVIYGAINPDELYYDEDDPLFTS